MFFLFLSAVSVSAQNQPSDTFSLDTTVNAVNIEGQEVIQDAVVDTLKRDHSPKLAALMSAVVPGAGQIYNQKYWKAPLVWAGLGISIYYIAFNNQNYIKYKNAYRDWIYTVRQYEDPTYISPEPNTMSYVNMESLSAINLDYYLENNPEYVTTFLYNNRYSYKRYRDLSFIISIGIYALNILDATVDAHLFDYDVGEDLSIKLVPSTPVFSMKPGFGLSCRLNF